MSQPNRSKTIAVDINEVGHKLRSALENFRTAHEILLEPEPSRMDANESFQSGEEKLSAVIELICGKRI